MTDSRTRVGIVESISSTRVRVRLDPQLRCELCATGRGCGGALLAANSSKATFVDVPMLASDLTCGDRVRLTLTPGSARLAIGALLLAPLIGLLVGAVIANQWLGDLATAGVSMGVFAALLVVGGFVCRGQSQGVRLHRCQPTPS